MGPVEESWSEQEAYYPEFSFLSIGNGRVTCRAYVEGAFDVVLQGRVGHFTPFPANCLQISLFRTEA